MGHPVHILYFKSLAGPTAGWGKVHDMVKTAGSPERHHPVTQQPTVRPRKPAQSTAPAAHFWDDISVQDQGRRGTFYQRPMYSLFNG